MSARHALEKQAARTEVHVELVSVQPAVDLPDPCQRSRNDVMAQLQLLRVACGIQRFVERDGVARLSRHVSQLLQRSGKSAVQQNCNGGSKVFVTTITLSSRRFVSPA
jgi:hypothetical protein